MFPAGIGAAGNARRRITEAIRSFGPIVEVRPEDFIQITTLQQDPLIVTALGGLIWKHHRYLTSYKGLLFFTKSPRELHLPTAEIIKTRRLYIPSHY